MKTAAAEGEAGDEDLFSSPAVCGTAGRGHFETYDGRREPAILIMMRTIKTIIRVLRFLPVLPWVDWGDRRLQMDIDRWADIWGMRGGRERTLSALLMDHPEFRNLFIYRNRSRRFFRSWIRLWYRPVDTLFLEAGEIGGGLFIQHGFATMVAADSIGENCWINQQVTIGYSGTGRPPVIGNNVMITCGAKVLGNITVGDNAVIGANAVVIRDVPSGVKVGGIPAHILGEKGTE